LATGAFFLRSQIVSKTNIFSGTESQFAHGQEAHAF
jgi:hypothetical protein